MWTNIYMDALLLATKAHDGQIRRLTKEPYIVHPIRVSKILYQLTGDLRLATAGLCHDILEDTLVEPNEIHASIIDVVQSVTKRKDLPKNEREEEFLSRYKNASLDTVLLKLADRADNVCDLKFQNQNFIDRYQANTIALLEATPKHHVAAAVVNNVAILMGMIKSSLASL